MELNIKFNREKYKFGTKFRIFGIPSVVIGNDKEGMAMSFYPISNKDTWNECYNEVNKFISEHNGWFIPSKSILEKYINCIKPSMFFDLSGKWLWTNTSSNFNEVYLIVDKYSKQNLTFL